MRAISRMVAVLLLALAPASLAVNAPAHAASPTPPAGCHGHKAPAPWPAAPVSYRCCSSGHNVSIPGASFSLRPSLVWHSNTDNPDALAATGAAIHHLLIPQPSPPGSPGLEPLRI